MNDRDYALLRKLGILVNDVEFDEESPQRDGTSPYTIRGTFQIDESRFRPMCRLIELVDLMCENKNPVAQEQFHHLVTLLNLTKENKHG